MAKSTSEKELLLINDYSENASNYNQKKITKNKKVIEIFDIFKNFIIKKKLCVYGGTAVNDILPQNVQFYNKKIHLPDYDVFSQNALNDAKEIADIYFNLGYKSVEAKSSIYKKTYKIFVNYIPVADITQMDDKLFSAIQKNAIIKKDIHYVPANFLRMLFYIEFSRPRGYVSRWNKLLQRLNLLNKYYPLPKSNCDNYIFQKKINVEKEHTLYNEIKTILINEKVVFIGDYAGTLLTQYLSKKMQQKPANFLDFIVIAKNPKILENKIKDKINELTDHTVDKKIYKSIDTILSDSIALFLNNKKFITIYKPLACHAYNNITINNKIIRVGSIETLFNFYLAFLYAEPDNVRKIICFCNLLFKLRDKNKLAKTGLLNRISMKCYGKQITMHDMLAERNKLYHKYQKYNDPTYNKYFLKYIPKHKTTKHKTTKHK